jgi:hypothetical protein
MITARAYYEDFRRKVGSPSTKNLLTTSAYAAPDLSPSATVEANDVANAMRQLDLRSPLHLLQRQERHQSYKARPHKTTLTHGAPVHDP